MAVTGVTEDQYRDLLKRGGSLTFVIEAQDIASDNAFENYEVIKPDLHSGFELPPTSIIHEPEDAAQILLLGDSWTRVIAAVYRNGGKIIYKKLTNGHFEACCTIPPVVSKEIKVVHTDGRALGTEVPPAFVDFGAGQHYSYKGTTYVIRAISGSTTQGPAIVVLADSP